MDVLALLTLVGLLAIGRPVRPRWRAEPRPAVFRHESPRSRRRRCPHRTRPHTVPAR